MFKRFLNDESGQGMVEYALIVALIAVLVVATIKLFGRQIRDLFKDSMSKINAQTNTD